MPTSDAKRKPWPRRALILLAVLAALLLLNLGLTLALEPYGANSEAVWYEYRQATAAGEQFDTIVIGSSAAQDSLQPGSLDEALGCRSFSLASPGQSLNSSYEALKLAASEHPVRRVILGTSYTQLAEEPWANSNMAFTQSMCLGRPLPEQAGRYLRLMLNPDYVGSFSSLLFLAPYTLSHVDYTPAAVSDNIHNRLTCATPLEAGHRVDELWVPLGQGYANYTGQLDPETLTPNLLGINNLAWLGLGGKGLNQSELAGLERICAFCEEQGIQLLVMASPHARLQLLSMAEVYPSGMAQVQQLVETGGALFVDMNLAKAELYENREQDFRDAGHLNMAGAQRLTPVLAELLQRTQAGEDLSGLFYSYDEWDELLRSLDQIYYVYFEEEREDGAVLLEATAYAGSSCQVEYAYELQSEDGSWARVRDWSADPVYRLPDEGYRSAQVRVLARQRGASEPERLHYQTVSLW